MLREQPCRQVPGEPSRRWISDDYFDLIVWGESRDRPIGFQLCYDKPGRERALTWTSKAGFSHATVDGGDSSPNANCTPILVADGCFPDTTVRREFLWRSSGIEPRLRDLVLKKIDEYAVINHSES